MTNWSRDPRRPERGQILASVVLHVFLLTGAWWAHRAADEPIEYVTYELQMVSAADVQEPEEVTLQAPEELVVETPDDLMPEPEPDPPLPDPDPEPEPVVEDPPPPPVEDPPPVEEPPPVREERRAQAETPPATEESAADVSAAEIAVRTEGLQRDFPEYYRNIVTQINACLRWSGSSNWTTVIRFTITSDGRVPGGSIRLQERSGSSAFDLAAVGAVECAGAGRLGPLPEDLPWDELPIQFTFSPRG